ncbi:ABC transporter ATP-binding protein [Faecalitalea cylindroides]|uniref:ABC transporter ATP-binding protein n=1 Tax=Faecalitalea cylindroides TaxID=39483 RepID=UPI00189AB6FC|nr:ABC transporter ATP-binding protein [Faecalitalea cylindroides]MDB7947249.1 ABC transporter ATP-binding protein [Faecalitalea cylindroides]MDB7949108.1 ABC transporter ATP-binding protein [Faecalitalea cylindroides]MDB7950992.1 ABC transporter ATP-binding protein [Faecalitalea cylindroides]
MAYIEFRGICKSYDGVNQVLKNIDLDVEKGELVTLLGPSGCGKSTLLRSLAGLEQISSGKIILDGEDITNLPVQKRGIGMVFQQYSLFQNMNVEENIAFGLKIAKMDKLTISEKVKKAIEMVDLVGKEKSYPSQLSGGQQQRVAIARAIVMEPKVLLLDEPLSAIDAKLRRELQEKIKNVQKKLKITTIFVTHDQDEAMIMSDRIHLMNQGIIEQSGKPVDLYTHPVSKFAAEFIGHYNILDKSKLNILLPLEKFDDGFYAIRPETVQIQGAPIMDNGMYTFEAVVENFISRGNVLRYTLRCGDVFFTSEVLFRSFALFEEGQKVYVGIEPHNILSIRD